MTNERHEKALEAAAWCGDIDWAAALADSQFASTPKAVEAIIAAYLRAMDAVIVPKELAFDKTLNDLGWDMNRFLHDGGAQFDGRVFNNMKAFLKTAIEKWVASSPNHFSNGE